MAESLHCISLSIQLYFHLEEHHPTPMIVATKSDSLELFKVTIIIIMIRITITITIIIPLPAATKSDPLELLPQLG